VHLRVRERGEDLGERHRILDRIRQHSGGPAALVTSQPPAIQKRMGLELGGAEHQLDPLPGLRVRDVVAAALEAEEPITRHDPGRPIDDQIRSRRQRQQRPVIALRPDRDDLAVCAVHPLAGDLLLPRQPAAVRLLVTGEAMAADQSLADPGHVVLDLPLRLRAVGLAEAHREPVVMRGRQGLGMKDPLLDRHVLADVLAHHGLGAVVEQLVRDAAEVRERRPVTRPERDQVLRAGQPAERIARMAEHHVEAVERQLQPRAGPDRLLMRPVDLRLEPGTRLEPRLAAHRRLRPGPLDVAADRVVTALEPVIPDEVLMHPRRQQSGLRREPLIDQRLKRIQLRRHPLPAVDRLNARLEIPLHRPPIPTEQPADLRVRVALTRKRPDVHQILLADNRRPPGSTTRAVERQDRLRQNSPTGGAQTARTRVTGSSPLRGSSPITRIPNPEASRSTYRIRWPSTGIIGWLRANVGSPTRQPGAPRHF
jgi:hypothetical protein